MKQFIIVLILLIFISFIPYRTLSFDLGWSSGEEPIVGETPYGGLRFFTLPCTCTDNFLVYIFDFATNSILKLIYEPGESVLYSYYDVWTSMFLLGSYVPDTGVCKVRVAYYCVKMDSDGQMGNQPGTGTSP